MEKPFHIRVHPASKTGFAQSGFLTGSFDMSLAMPDIKARAQRSMYHDQMQRAVMRFSWQVLMSLEQTAQKVSSQTSEYRQVYAVVSKMGVPWDVYYFMQAQARDDLLPFMLTQDGKALQPWLTEEEEASGVSAPLKVPGWEDGRYREFHNVPWEQLPLKFKLGESYELYANSVVPLIEEVPE